MNIGETYLGRNVQAFEKGNTLSAVDQVIINYCTSTDGTVYSATAGTHSTGRILEKTIQTVTSYSTALSIAEALLAKYASDPYLPVTVSGSELDPAVELGDAMTVNGVYTGIGAITTEFSKGMIADIEAQGQPEEDDFPYLNSESRRVERQTNAIYSRITVTADAIRSEVYGSYAPTYSATTEYFINDMVKYVVNNVTHYYRCKKLLTSTYTKGIDPTDSTYWDDLGESGGVTVSSLIENSLNGITISYSTSGSNNSAYIKLNKDGVEIAGGTITMSNVVADSVSANWVYAGTLNASQITAGTISANRLDLSGYLTVSAGDTRYDATGTASTAVDALETEMASGTTTISGGCITTGLVKADYLKLGSSMSLYNSTDSAGTTQGWFGYGRITTSSWTSDGCGILAYNSVAVGSNYYAYIGGGTGYYTQIHKYLAGDDSLRPSVDDTYDLGSTATRWQDIYATNTVIQTSDRELKKDITYNFDMDSFFDSLKPCSYKFKNGNSGRTHWGMIAQDIEDSLADCGLTSMDFAGFCKSTKVTTELQNDNDGQHYHDVEHEGLYDYGLRYEEFIALCINQIQKLKARVKALEG